MNKACLGDVGSGGGGMWVAHCRLAGVLMLPGLQALHWQPTARTPMQATF